MPKVNDGVIWVRSSDYAYWGKENTPPPQHRRMFYKKVKTGPLSVEEWCEQYGIDPGEQPLPGTEVGETPVPKVPDEPPPEDESPSEPVSEDEPTTDEEPVEDPAG